MPAKGLIDRSTVSEVLSPLTEKLMKFEKFEVAVSVETAEEADDNSFTESDDEKFPTKSIADADDCAIFTDEFD